MSAVKQALILIFVGYAALRWPGLAYASIGLGLLLLLGWLLESLAHLSDRLLARWFDYDPKRDALDAEAIMDEWDAFEYRPGDDGNLLDDEGATS